MSWSKGSNLCKIEVTTPTYLAKEQPNGSLWFYHNYVLSGMWLLSNDQRTVQDPTRRLGLHVLLLLLTKQGVKPVKVVERMPDRSNFLDAASTISGTAKLWNSGNMAIFWGLCSSLVLFLFLDKWRVPTSIQWFNPAARRWFYEVRGTRYRTTKQLKEAKLCMHEW